LWNTAYAPGTYARGVAVDSHDNIIVTGYDSNLDYHTVKYNSSGSVLWNRTDTGGFQAYGVAVDSQDNVVVTGRDSNSDYRTVKYNGSGFVLWNRTDSQGGSALGVATDSHDNIIVTGFDSNSDYRTIKYNTLWNPMDCGYMRSGQACETGWLINATGANGRAFWIDIYAVSNYSDLYGRTKDTWDRKICIGNCIPPTVQLLSPASASSVGSSVVLRCSASSNNNYLKNISLYTNKTGSWQINETVSFGASKPLSYEANFSLTSLVTGGYKWNCLAYDNASLSDWADSNWTFVRMNRLPNVTLIWPNDGNTTTDYNRTPKLRWYGYDPDGDKLNFTVLIECMAADCGGYLEKKEINLTYENWTLSEELEVDVPYNWTVRAFDGTNYSAWSTVWNFTVASHLVITLTNAKTNFGALLRLQQANTTKSGDSIEPLVVRNDGNVYFDAFAKANNSLWITASLNISYYQFMAGNATNIRTFNWSGSQNIWRNVSSENLKVIDTLNYSSHKSNATIELKVIVPYDEPPGARSSAMIVSGEVK
jgi:hypothetical protein